MSQSNLVVILIVTFLLVGGLASIASDSADAATPSFIALPCGVNRLDALKRQTEEARVRWAAGLSPEAHQSYTSARNDFVEYAMACANTLGLDLRRVLELNPIEPPLVTSKTELGDIERRQQPLIPLATFGPDAFGYVYIDSDEPDGPSFSFIDISSSGTAITLGDDDSSNVPIGFTFNFYGQDYTTVNVSSNGYLKFTTGSTTLWENDCPIPDATGPDTAIYALWDDLDPSSGGAIYYETRGVSPNQVFIVQYNQVPFSGDSISGAVTFEVLLFESSNEIRIEYQDVEGSARKTGSLATQGIESQAGYGPTGLLYKGCNAANNLKNSLAVLYTIDGQADLGISKTATASASVGELITYTLGVTNTGPAEARNVVVLDYLPAGVSGVSYWSSTGACMAGVPGEPLRPTTCNLGTMPNGRSETIVIVVRLVSGSPGTLIFNDAQVSSDTEDPYNGNNVTTAATQDATPYYLFLPIITR